MTTASTLDNGEQGSTSSAPEFSVAERKAMKERAAELKAQARRGSAAEKLAAEKAAVLAKIAEMKEPDRVMAERLNGIVADAAPELSPKLYYGQPGWAKAGKVVVFFRSGLDDKERYSTLGFSAAATLDDDGGLWPTSYALDHLTDKSAAVIADLVKRAAS
ncbi:hypothetical protein B0I08_10433 [Glaciihabitans tibetensis]|uniref:YdhG-like domain-containing protein n=1 Tax=Glaciihabitans tibetensis TaxID=1266600 RepID=A0A2T0VDT6_9MICO|nr:DUF1801 domain-containing protein [Glaciihabitans tibetensis]PRY68331.1 hypothetical protein B0I08_10433 [Glaciihabitans tibetensis]